MTKTNIAIIMAFLTCMYAESTTLEIFKTGMYPFDTAFYAAYALVFRAFTLPLAVILGSGWLLKKFISWTFKQEPKVQKQTITIDKYDAELFKPSSVFRDPQKFRKIA